MAQKNKKSSEFVGYESYMDRAERYIEGGHDDIVWDGESEILDDDLTVSGGDYDIDFTLDYDFNDELVIFEPGVVGSGEMSFIINLYNDKAIDDTNDIFKPFKEKTLSHDIDRDILSILKPNNYSSNLSTVKDILGAVESIATDLSTIKPLISTSKLVNFKVLKDTLRKILSNIELN